MYVLELSPVIDVNRLSKLQVRLVSQLHLPIDRLFASPGLAVILAASLLGQGSSTAFTAGQSDRLPDILGRTSATPSPRPSARAIARPTTRPAAARKKPAARASNRPTATRPVKKPAKPAVATRPATRPAQKPAKPTVAIRPPARPVQKPAKPTVAIRPPARPVRKPAKPTVAIRPPARPVQKPAKPAVVTRSSPSPRPVPAPVAPPVTPTPPVAPMAGPFQDQASMTALANHLTQSGAKVYTAYWCGYCRKQVEMFGSAKLTLPVIECDPRGQNPQTDLCRKKAVQGYPTWEMNGEMYRGMQEVNVLADLSGYRGPRN
jgi:hypothetical protein